MTDSPEVLSPIFSYAFAVLARKPYSRQELLDALEKKFPGAEDSLFATVLEELERLKYIDDRKFAEDFVRYRRETSPRGKLLLERELRAKKIPSSILHEVLAENTPEDQLHDALEIGKRKWKILESFPSKEKRREKLFRFLLGRGFSLSLCHSVLKLLSQDEDFLE